MHWSTICSPIFGDKEITYKAKGIASYFAVGKFDLYKDIRSLLPSSSTGRDATYSGVNELIRKKYLIQEFNKNEEERYTGVNYRFNIEKVDENFYYEVPKNKMSLLDACLDCTQISWKAKGIYSHLIYSDFDLINYYDLSPLVIGKTKRYALITGVIELIKAGFLSVKFSWTAKGVQLYFPMRNTITPLEDLADIEKELNDDDIRPWRYFISYYFPGYIDPN